MSSKVDSAFRFMKALSRKELRRFAQARHDEWMMKYVRMEPEETHENDEVFNSIETLVKAMNAVMEQLSALSDWFYEGEEHHDINKNLLQRKLEGIWREIENIRRKIKQTETVAERLRKSLKKHDKKGAKVLSQVERYLEDADELSRRIETDLNFVEHRVGV